MGCLSIEIHITTRAQCAYTGLFSFLQKERVRHWSAVQRCHAKINRGNSTPPARHSPMSSLLKRETNPPHAPVLRCQTLPQPTYFSWEATSLNLTHLIIYAAVPSRIQTLFRRVFRSCYCIQSAILLRFH